MREDGQRLQLDADVDTGRQDESVEHVDGLRSRLEQVHEPLVSADLKLLAGLLVYVRRAQHGVALDACRKRDGARDLHPRQARGFDDRFRGLIDGLVIVGFESDLNAVRHV